LDEKQDQLQVSSRLVMGQLHEKPDQLLKVAAAVGDGRHVCLLLMGYLITW